MHAQFGWLLLLLSERSSLGAIEAITDCAAEKVRSGSNVICNVLLGINFLEADNITKVRGNAIRGISTSDLLRRIHGDTQPRVAALICPFFYPSLSVCAGWKGKITSSKGIFEVVDFEEMNKPLDLLR